MQQSKLTDEERRQISCRQKMTVQQQALDGIYKEQEGKNKQLEAKAKTETGGIGDPWVFYPLIVLEILFLTCLLIPSWITLSIIFILIIVFLIWFAYINISDARYAAKRYKQIESKVPQGESEGKQAIEVLFFWLMVGVALLSILVDSLLSTMQLGIEIAVLLVLLIMLLIYQGIRNLYIDLKIAKIFNTAKRRNENNEK